MTRPELIPNLGYDQLKVFFSEQKAKEAFLDVLLISWDKPP